MANILKIRKVNTLPGTYDPSTLYMVKSAESGLFDLYVSTDDGASARHLISKPEITSMINTAIASFSTVQVVATIAARDALNPTTTTQVIVVDATGDATVASGTATYVYDLANTTWVKISESESMDVVLQWSNIQGKPSSAVADIEDAVDRRHSHANSSVLSGLSDIGGALAYGGAPVRAYLEEESW
jgi:hypothetical protein